MDIITHPFIAHLKLGKFPLNTSIFTGEVPLEECRRSAHHGSKSSGWRASTLLVQGPTRALKAL